MHIFAGQSKRLARFLVYGFAIKGSCIQYAGNNMKIRKQVYDLKLEDFQQHPIWEFALDEEGEEGQDEATVRPYSSAGPANPEDGTLVVKARFALADGTTMDGWITPPFGEFLGLGTIQPQIITPEGPVSFWFGGLKPTTKDLAQCYKRLGHRPESVFPLRFQSEVDIVGGPVSGVLDGFLYMEMKNEKVHKIT